MTQSKSAVRALELMRQLGVNYNTAWLMKQKLLQTALVREQACRPGGRVEFENVQWAESIQCHHRVCGLRTEEFVFVAVSLIA